MSVASAVLASAALLLVAAGAAKLIRPSDGYAGLVGFRIGPLSVRLLGGVEVAAGAAALWLGGPVAASAVGLLYGLFALAVGRALLAGAESCGCFGRLDAPPSRIHVLANLALAAVSFAAVGADGAAIPVIARTLIVSPAVGVALAVEIVVLAGLALVTFTALPEALAARTSRADAVELFRRLSPPHPDDAVDSFRPVSGPGSGKAASSIPVRPR